MSEPTHKIIGIGASAGGLAALEEFFTCVPHDSGYAFVVVQHLDPNHTCILHELLQTVSKMPVTQITGKTYTRPNHVYVIPPNCTLSFSKGQLNLTKPKEAHGFRLPIDIFFTSLADDLAEQAIGIVFSGMGSDGMLGLKAIKKSGGLTMAQLPVTAKFDSMPQSAIDSKMVDIVASPKQMAQNIVEYIAKPRLAAKLVPNPLMLNGSSLALEKIFSVLHRRTGNDFSVYKESTIFRRIERRLRLHHINSLDLYADFLAENTQELDFLFKELLIGVTRFFRDESVWQEFINKSLPLLLMQFPEGKTLRAWVAACSTGEEAYTLAIAIQECLALIKPEQPFSLQIFATDLDDNAIAIAREGYYSQDIENDISADRLHKYFVPEQSGYRICKNIREMIVFATQNIIVDPPFTNLDIFTCRNLLIYFNGDLQKKIMLLMHYALQPDGLLMLGQAESIGDFTHLFSKSNQKYCLYQRKNTAIRPNELDFPTRLFPVSSADDVYLATGKNMNENIVNLQSLADQVLIKNFVPAAVLVNSDGDILYINGRTGKYLEPAAGKANWNIFAMAREGIRYELNLAMKKAQGTKDAILIKGRVVDSSGMEQGVQLKVKAIDEPGLLINTLMITFEDIATLPKNKQKATTPKDQGLLQELTQAQEQIRLMSEEMKTSQEELKAANEELQSTNEELQSTNEELTTSKEEMQSLNEELQTLNIELQTKVEDLTGVKNDMTNLLNSTEVATIFLDNELNIRQFTTLATQLYKLIPSDVGRPLSDIVTVLAYETLQDDANGVLRTLVFHERQVISKAGRWFKARIMPYRTQKNMIDGVVITFMDITQFKSLETKLQELGYIDD